MDVKPLLENVAGIIKQNEQLSILKGENFNVFQIFDMEGDENKMHSRFINTLLDPEGKHGRGTAFLKLFLETLNIPDYFENIDNVRTKVEHVIGEVKISGIKSTGGRIDIYLWDNNKSISIENKIYATDQEKQIVRYYNYKKGSNRVYYLNLYGTEPDGDFSKGNLKSNTDERAEQHDFFCISYSETILDWLGKCQKEASDFPILRETIKQYIITIKRITGQLINQKMNEEINRLIIENYESAKVIADNVNRVKIKVVDDFLNDLISQLKKDLKDAWIIKEDDIKKKWSLVKIYHKDWLPEAAIILQGQPYFWNDVSIVGLPAHKHIRQIIETECSEDELNAIKADFPKGNKNMVFYKFIFNFGDDNQFPKLLSTDTKKELIERVSYEVKNLANQLEPHLKREKI